MNPQRIGKYEIVGKLGQGAMGEVFRGHDPVLNREVAIKRISAGLDADENIRHRFMREAKAVAQLSHRNIITVYELGTEGDQAFMAMELLDGIDLKHAIAHAQDDPRPEARRRSSRSSRASPSPTARASSTATSSPRTCTCCRTGSSRSWTSASPR